MKKVPTLFVSHGSPMLALEPSSASEFLKELGHHLAIPRAILVISAHWESSQPMVSTTTHPATIHDFRGFPPALYQLQYPAPGAPDLAEQVVQLLTVAKLDPRIHPTRGLDHGAWVPLYLMYPETKIPVTQLSLQTHLGPLHALRMGEALAPLAQQGVLIIGSGSATHNLGEFSGSTLEAPPPTWVTAFEEWLTQKLLAGDLQALLDFYEQAPFAARNHPTAEHLLPLFVAYGAGGGVAQLLHRSFTYGVLSMAAYGFGKEL